MRNPNWTEEDIYRIAERGHSLHLQGRYREAAVIFQGLIAVDPRRSTTAGKLWPLPGWPWTNPSARSSNSTVLTRQPGDLAVRVRRVEAYLLAGDFSGGDPGFRISGAPAARPRGAAARTHPGGCCPRPTLPGSVEK